MTKFLYDHEIVEQLLTSNNILTDKDRKKLYGLPEENLEKFHDEFGKEIRNFYSLWNMHNPNTFEYKTEKMIKHPTEVSMEIIKKVWKRINEL